MYMQPKTPLFTLYLSVLFFCLLSSPLFAQCIEGDCQNGKGTMQFPGGSQYIGEWKNGQMNGKGEFIFYSGAEYAGEWREDKLIHYTNLATTPQNGNILADTGSHKETQKSDIEKQFLDKDFDPSTDLPAAAAGLAKK
jgi:hypothetical protein